MKGVNHGQEESRQVIQVYYQHNLGKDNQARLSSPLASQGEWCWQVGGENPLALWVLFFFYFFFFL